MLTDTLNKPLTEGDYVIVVRKEYRGMVIGRILKFTPKQVKVLYLNNWNFSDPRPEEYLTTEVVKIEPEDVVRIKAELKVKLDEAYGKATCSLAA